MVNIATIIKYYEIIIYDVVNNKDIITMFISYVAYFCDIQLTHLL